MSFSMIFMRSMASRSFKMDQNGSKWPFSPRLSASTGFRVAMVEAKPCLELRVAGCRSPDQESHPNIIKRDLKSRVYRPGEPSSCYFGRRCLEHVSPAPKIFCLLSKTLRWRSSASSSLPAFRRMQARLKPVFSLSFAAKSLPVRCHRGTSRGGSCPASAAVASAPLP